MDETVKIIEAAADLLESRKNITSPQQYALELAKEVAKLSALAEREACARLVAPKTPRPCDCESCDCGNKDDAQKVAEWDAENFAATAIRLRSNA